MATSRGALKPRRTVPPRTSTTCTSMSSPMRIVSPTLRVSVSTSTPPWVWVAVHGCARERARSAVSLPEVQHAELRCAAPPGSLSAQGAPDRMVAVVEHDLAGQAAGGVHDDRGAQVRRRPADVAVGHGDDAVQLGVGVLRQAEL